MSRSQTAMVYFGKIPSRGDFVRSPNQAALTQTLDRWLAQGIELMAADARWKEVYDHAAPAHFAFLGARSRVALAGHLVASSDASGRRFPFVAAGSFEVDPPLAFIARSPMALARSWARFAALAQAAVAADDATPVLAELSHAAGGVDAPAGDHDERFHEFVDLQTIGALESMLRAAGHALHLRRTLLALGLLLQPVPASGSNHLDNGLQLPLPADPLYAPYVSTLWLDLVSRFLTRGDFEIALFVSQPSAGPHAGDTAPPALRIGFSGGSPATLHAVLDPAVGRRVFVDLADSDWVEDQIASNYAVKKLSSYLEQPQLSLRQALATFGEAFLGD